MNSCMSDSDKNASEIQSIVLFTMDSVSKINIYIYIHIYVYVCGGSTWPIIFIRSKITIVDNCSTQIFYHFHLVEVTIYLMNVHATLAIIWQNPPLLV